MRTGRERTKPSGVLIAAGGFTLRRVLSRFRSSILEAVPASSRSESRGSCFDASTVPVATSYFDLKNES